MMASRKASPQTKRKKEKRKKKPKLVLRATRAECVVE
jgi:hypothetical protein